MISVIALALIGQQVGKFDDRPPAFVVTAPSKLEDVERCMIRYGSPPIVYRQPDRPDDVTLVWLAGGNSAGRVDLRREGASTLVKSWMPIKAIRACADGQAASKQ